MDGERNIGVRRGKVEGRRVGGRGIRLRVSFWVGWRGRNSGGLVMVMEREGGVRWDW